MIKQIQLKRELITAKSELKILKLQEAMAHQEKGILHQLEPMPNPEKVGKRIFKVESNKQTDMITHEGCERVFERRNERDFPDYLKPSNLTMPEIVKPKQVASGKMKVSVDYIKKMLGDEGISEARGNLIRTLHEENVDIRLLNNLKRQLLDSKNVQRGNLLSIEEYIEIKNKILKGKQLKADHLLLEEIKGSET